MHRILLFLAVIGPGLITAFSGNDAGGIATYTVAGASFGYRQLWALLVAALGMIVINEMSARMGAVTGKGLSDLIREQFGVRWTLFAMSALLIANTATTVANLAGLAASAEILGARLPPVAHWLVARAVSVPLLVAAVWLLITRTGYRAVERAFLGFTLIFVSYIIAGFAAHPSWETVVATMFVPSRQWLAADAQFIRVVIAIIGCTIAPWMQFYLQSSTVEKGIHEAQFRMARVDVVTGAVAANIIAVFIVVAAAVRLHPAGAAVTTADQAALALEPVAGAYASLLFAVGLFGASMLAAAVVPLSTAYAVCEAFGWESGLDRRLGEAPRFFGIFTGVLIISAVPTVIPRAPLIDLMVLSQVVNGCLLPVILVFMLLLVNRPSIMGARVNSRLHNAIAWGVAGVIMALIAAMLVVEFA